AGGVALLEIPALVDRPRGVEQRPPAGPGLGLGERMEREGDGHGHGTVLPESAETYSILKPNGSGVGVSTACSSSTGTPRNCRLMPSTHVRARAPSSCSSSMNRPRVTRMPRSAPG